MKKEFSTGTGTRLINSGPVTIIGSKGDNWYDFSTVAWIMPMSKSPPKMVMCVGPSHETWKNIKKTGEFTVNIPGRELIKETAYFGSVSGKDIDKIKTSNVNIENGSEVDVKVLANCLGYLECKMVSMDEDSHLIIGEMVKVMAEEKAFTDHWNIKGEYYPLNHLGGDNYQCGNENLKQMKIKNW